MNGTRPWRLDLLIAAALLVGSPSLTSAQEANRALSPYGTDQLGKELKLRRCTALRSWDDLAFAPHLTMLVMIGRCDLGNVPGGLDRFIRNGGAVLIASDDPIANAQDLIDLCGHNVKGGKVLGWNAKARNAGDPNVAAGTDVRNVFQPIFDPLPEFVKIDGLPNHDPPLFVDASKENKGAPLRIITLLPSYLEQQGRDLPRGTKVVARFPSGCAYDGSYLAKDATPPPFVVATEVDGGRVLLMADQDPLLNYFTLHLVERLRHMDNLGYLYNALQWLQEDRRRFALLVVDGAIQTEFNPATDDDPRPLHVVESVLIDNANKILMNWQADLSRRNRLNSQIIGPGSNAMDGPGYRSSAFYVITIAILGLAAILFGFLKLRRASYRLEPGVPLLSVAVHRQAPPLSTVQHRQRAALEENNYGEHAKALALEWFARLPGNPASNDAGVGPPVPPDAPPRVLVQGSWLRRLGLRNMVRKTWHLATDEFAPRMTRGQFHQVLAQILRLRDAVATGELRLEW